MAALPRNKMHLVDRHFERRGDRMVLTGCGKSQPVASIRATAVLSFVTCQRCRRSKARHRLVVAGVQEVVTALGDVARGLNELAAALPKT